jgi:16S rRNA (cytosine967-C5)-methyltransferase
VASLPGEIIITSKGELSFDEAIFSGSLLYFYRMRSYSHLNTVKKIVESYDGSMPFAAWLKQFFQQDKKFGSQDRKQIAHASYCYYRLGGSFREIAFEERVLTALYLCSNSPNRILEELKSEWNDSIGQPIDKKLENLSATDEIEKVFPFNDELSAQIDFVEFNKSVLTQPHLFLRIRPGKQTKALKQLEEAGIKFTLLNNECIQLDNQSKIDEVLDIDGDVVVQDYNSQRTIEVVSDYHKEGSKVSVWDCCAASGGKSILVHDHYPAARLTVSDVRESILVNLRNRFKRAGISHYESFVTDLSVENFSSNKQYDLVLCDAPCSGSGTWSRTPEQLYFFKRENIDEYAELQKKIVNSASRALKQGGYLLYITCSVFSKENEEVVEFIQSNLSLRLNTMQYLKGYDRKADTLFVALFSTL